MTPEEAVAQATKMREERREAIITQLSNPAELNKILTALAERPELKGAEFGPAGAVLFHVHQHKISVNIRSDKEDKLAGYDYSFENSAWGEPKPVRVIGGKDKDFQRVSLWSEVKPDLGMAFDKANEVLQTLPPETVGQINSIQYYPKQKHYTIETGGDGSSSAPQIKFYKMTLDESGQILKKNW